MNNILKIVHSTAETWQQYSIGSLNVKYSYYTLHLEETIMKDMFML